MIFGSAHLARRHARPGHLTRAFTLIELLVVIAIIGILSAVILASLNTARSKGVDASIKSDLNTIQTQAELDYDSCGSSGGAFATTAVNLPSAYATSWSVGTGTSGNTGVCPFGSSAAGDQTAESALNQAATSGGVRIGYSATYYIVVAQLTTSGAGLWCVDSSGNAKAETSVGSGSGVTQCP